MKDEFIIYTFVNYVLLMGITLISILKKVSFYSYMEVILITALCVNLVLFCVHNIKKVLEDVEKSSFTLDVSSSEDEIKDLLRQVGNEELEQESAEQASEEEDQNIKTEGA